jgi:hypothetical protein
MSSWDRIDTSTPEAHAALLARLAKAKTYTPARSDPTFGRLHLCTDGQVLHETADGHWQTSVHSVDALADPTRFAPVDA